MADTDAITFIVGDSDLVFLGVAAAMAARYEALRKSKMRRDGVPMSSALPVNDADALAQVRLGVELGALASLDDVAEIVIEVSSSKDTWRRLKRLATRPEGADDGE